MVADASLWFDRHRGLAIALATIGSSLSGVVWPPIIQHFIAEFGWRQTHIGIGIFCMATMLPLALVLRRRPVSHKPAVEAASIGNANQAIGLPPNVTHALLTLAGLCCCVAMAMPQVHLVAYCADLGYGPARGAEMLAVMLGFGVVSRLIFGWVLNRIGGLPTLLLGSTMQAVALALYLPFDGLVSLYVISAIFGLAQGGLVPSYAVIIRELFPAQEAGLRVSLAISTTLAGMALGGWLAGAIYDWTGSYAARAGQWHCLEHREHGDRLLAAAADAWARCTRRRVVAAVDLVLTRSGFPSCTILVAEFRMCFHYWWANYAGYGSWRRWHPIALQQPYL